MLLVLDIGNTEVTVGLYAGDVLRGHWRLMTSIDRTPDEWALALEAFIVRAGHSPGEVRSVCIASVAPSVTQAMVAAVEGTICTRIAMVDASAQLPLILDVDEPLSVGADRIVNALAALSLYPPGAIVVDFGTATTFDCVTSNRHFIGGAIMPGLRTSADQLVRRAAKLTATELLPPLRAIGRRTDENIRSGVLFGNADAVDGMINRIRAEWPEPIIPTVIATGGLASLIAPLTARIDVVKPELTLFGLRLAAIALGVTA